MIVDSDTHIVEPEGMWEYLDPALRPRRPVVIRYPNDTLYGSRNATWLIDGQIAPKPAGVGGFRLHSPSVAEFEQARTDTRVECRELTDVAARLEDLDALTVDVQVVYPTLFLVQLTADRELDLGLARAYNRFLADATAASHGRIRWIFVPSVQDPVASIADLEQAQNQGAVGVLLHGLADHKSLADPYFFPLYERARDLDLPICVHTGSGSAEFRRFLHSEISASFYHFTLPVLVGFRDILANKIPQRFPGLRFGFIEAGAAWVPFILNHLSRGTRAVSTPTGGEMFTSASLDPSDRDYLAENNIFVSCLTDEDLPYLVSQIGEQSLIIGSDYGHIDQAFEKSLVATLESRRDLPDPMIRRILGDNAVTFYGLDT